MLALTACSNVEANNADSDANGGTETVDTALPAAEGTTDYPLTLTTWVGDSVLEERPERIAVIGVSPNFDYLEALDVVPIYTVTEDTDWAWRDAAWTEQIETVDTATRRDDVNLEGIAQTEPDLIVAFNSIDDDTTYNRLTDIAPVLDFEQKEGDQGDWREAQLSVGEALDLSEAAETAVAEVDDYIAQVKADNPQFEASPSPWPFSTTTVCSSTTPPEVRPKRSSPIWASPRMKPVSSSSTTMSSPTKTSRFSTPTSSSSSHRRRSPRRDGELGPVLFVERG